MTPLVTTSLLVAASFGAGVVDAIGGGGGLITLPALLAAGVPPHVAIATNKGQASFGALSSAVSFWRKDGVDRARAPLTFVAAFLGSCAGAAIVLLIPPAPLRPIVLALLVATAILVLLRRDVTSPKPRTLASPRLALAAVSFALGAYDGFFGPGTGTLLIVAFVIVFGDAMTRASGNAKVANLASNVSALGVFAASGVIRWDLALPMAVTNVIGAALGAHVALRRGDRFVRWIVLAVVTCLVVKVAVDVARTM